MIQTIKNKTSTQSGNAFILVFIGIALFAGLMMSFSRSSRQGTSDLSDRQASLAVTEIMSYAQRASRSIDRIMRKPGVSEVDISFDSVSFTSGYTNSNCSTTKCQVFNTSGGALNYQAPQEIWIDLDASEGAADWVFNAGNSVVGAGNDCGTASCGDLILLLPFIKENLCIKLNDELDVTNPSGNPPVLTDTIDIDPFTGSYANNELIAASGNAKISATSACVQASGGDLDGTYHFYYVMKAR